MRRDEMGWDSGKFERESDNDGDGTPHLCVATEENKTCLCYVTSIQFSSVRRLA